jgi:glycosyltransferase involved in cell wall biosynthesis
VLQHPGLSRRWIRPWAIRSLMNLGGPTRPNLLHVLGPSAADAGLALAESWRIPYVLTIDEFMPVGGKLRLSRGWCRAVVASGNELAEDLVGSVGVPRRLVVTIRPGIEISNQTFNSQVLPGKVPVIGAAGPLTSDSGLAGFLQSASRVITAGLDAEFILSGHGPSEEPLRRLAARLGIADRVTFAHDVTGQNTFCGVLDLFCLTSLTPTTGRELLNAMAAGIPVIATDVTGLGSLLNAGAGVIIPAGDVDALADALVATLAEPNRQRELGLRGRERILSDFDPDREVQELAALYQRVLSKPSYTPLPRRFVRADPRSAAGL